MDKMNMSNIPNKFQTFCSEILVGILRFYLISYKISNKKRPASLENTGFSYLPVTFTDV